MRRLRRKEFVKKMSFFLKSGVKDWGSDSESEGGDCDEVIWTGWGEPGGQWTEWGWQNEEESCQSIISITNPSRYSFIAHCRKTKWFPPTSYLVNYCTSVDATDKYTHHSVHVTQLSNAWVQAAHCTHSWKLSRQKRIDSYQLPENSLTWTTTGVGETDQSNHVAAITGTRKYQQAMPFVNSNGRNILK